MPAAWVKSSASTRPRKQAAPSFFAFPLPEQPATSSSVTAKVGPSKLTPPRTASSLCHLPIAAGTWGFSFPAFSTRTDPQSP